MKKYSLFLSRDFTVAFYEKQLNLSISRELLACADEQLSALFEKLTGIRCNSRTGFAPNFPDAFTYVPGAISHMSLRTYINHNWNPGGIAWKSHSGRIYKIDDTDIDCRDIEFWFEGLDVALVRKQMFPNQPLPFKLPKLSYEFVCAAGVNKEVDFDMTVTSAAVHRIAAIPAIIDEFLLAFQQEMEEEADGDGTLGQWTWHIDGDRLICGIRMQVMMRF